MAAGVHCGWPYDLAAPPPQFSSHAIASRARVRKLGLDMQQNLRPVSKSCDCKTLGLLPLFDHLGLKRAIQPIMYAAHCSSSS